MTYQEYSVHMKVCDFLRKEPTGEYKKIHDHFTGIWDGMEIVVESITNRIVFQKGVIWFFEQEQKSVYLWCNYAPVWSFFVKGMGMEITETKDFIKSAVEEHLKCEVGTPQALPAWRERRVEEHLKCEVGTPSPQHYGARWQVEEHLKCEVGTPVLDECEPVI